MVWAYQRWRIIGMRMTSPMERGAGIAGSIGGFGIDSAGAGLGEVVLMGGEFMVLDCGRSGHLMGFEVAGQFEQAYPSG
jgi:hypothetical protein